MTRTRANRPPRRACFCIVVLSTVALAPAVVHAAPADKQHSHREPHWVNAWQASPTPGGTFNPSTCPSDVGLKDQTVRDIVYLAVPGNGIRVHVSNAGGTSPLRIGSASIAVSGEGAATAPGTSVPLQFNGQASILIAAGGEALSDRTPINVQPFESLAVSIYLPEATGPATQHYFAGRDNFLGDGDQTRADGASSFTQKISCYLFLSGVDLIVSNRIRGTVVTLGDSITDGSLSTPNANHRYPDYLARRLLTRAGPQLAVSNAGISGNEVLTIRPQIQFGYPAPARLSRDVLTQAGVRAVILMEGINDIGDKSAKAEDLIPMYQQIIEQVHAAGIKIFGGTLVPFGGSTAKYKKDYGTPAGEVQRQLVNTWIRTSGAFDGVIDFDKATRDPANPTALLPAYDANGDHLHPSDAGYAAMANAVDLDALFKVIGESR